jgi:hypothetical protein
MKMTGPRPKTFFAGAALLWRRQRVLWLIYAVNLLLALMAARSFAGLAGRILNHSLAADQLVHGFNLERLIELASQPDSPVRASVTSTFYFSMVFAVFMLFSMGGILVGFYEDRRLTAAPFFEACGNIFWRFLRLALYFGVVMIPFGILVPIANSIYTRMDAQSISPYPGVVFLAGAAAVITLLLMCVRLWFDMAQVIAVAEYERAMHRALRRSARLICKNFVSLFWLYLRISLAGWMVLGIGLYLWSYHLRPDAILRAFLLGQALVLLGLATRLWQRASEALWYRQHQAAFFASAPVVASAAPSTAALATTPLAPESN